MNKRDYQELERQRCEKAANAAPIIRITVLNGQFHVIAMRSNGTILHKVFDSLSQAQQCSAQLTREESARIQISH